MIEDFKELELNKIEKTEDVEKILKEKLGIGFTECAQSLSDAVSTRTEELIEDLPNIAPYNDYNKLIEEKEDMIIFLQKEACKIENWEFIFMQVRKDKDQLMELVFSNKAVDGGDILKGFVFLGLSGKIRHSFAQIQ